MIDFRYHLVSLISVFLALAVGIILGAGPLQGAIGETLTEQVDALRAERTDLRTELDATQTALDGDERYIEAVGTQLVTGSLEGKPRGGRAARRGPAGRCTDGVLNQLDTAGANVVSRTVLTESWTDPAEESSRETVADGLRANLGAAPPRATTRARRSARRSPSRSPAATAAPTAARRPPTSRRSSSGSASWSRATSRREAAQALVLLVGSAGQPQADGRRRHRGRASRPRTCGPP